jgi:hypothetical protein
VYLGLTLSRPTTMVGVFLLPVVIALMVIAAALPRDAVFPRDRARLSWELAHGMMLLAGMVTVSLGFVAGLMYLVQSYRLKHHVSPQAGLKLPSLEWLQAVNKQSLVYSSFFIALGLVAGIVLNTIKARVQAGALPWTDSVVISSAVLLVWLLAATAFEWLYKPAQQGRKVAYLTVASFVFLALVITMLLIGGSEHAQPAVGGRSVGDRSVRGRWSVGRLAGNQFMRSVLGTEYWVPGTGYTAFVVPTTDRPTTDHRPPTDRREAGL